MVVLEHPDNALERVRRGFKPGRMVVLEDSLAKFSWCNLIVRLVVDEALLVEFLCESNDLLGDLIITESRSR